MGFFSILPESLDFIEAWLVRLFLMLAIAAIGPWMLFLLYDVLLYFWRTATYELPYLGGRARGRQRPRAPSLTERPDGHKRRMSIAGTRQPVVVDEAGDGMEAKSSGAVQRTPYQSVREET